MLLLFTIKASGKLIPNHQLKTVAIDSGESILSSILSSISSHKPLFVWLLAGDS